MADLIGVDVINAWAKTLYQAEMAKQLESTSLFYRLIKNDARPPVLGPPIPTVTIGDLTIEHDANRGIIFSTPGWESEPAHLTRKQVRRLRRILKRWA